MQAGNEAGDGEACTKSTVRRLIYFRGHKREENSAMITKVAMNYETFSSLLKGQTEFATRTLSNLYNLATVRGALAADGALDIEASMSGPHAYYGYLDPRDAHTVSFDSEGNPQLVKFPHSEEAKKIGEKKDIDDKHIVTIKRYNWIRGRDIQEQEMKRYQLCYVDEDESFLQEDQAEAPVLVLRASQEETRKKAKISKAAKGKGNEDSSSSNTNVRSDDSLFEYPGVLEFDTEELSFLPLTEAHTYDLSSFHAQVVPNDQPFAFNRAGVDDYEHAQHRLRVITYCYGPRYVSDYLMAGNGIFIERHDFIQSITPMLPTCGGAVLLGRLVDIDDDDDVEKEEEEKEKEKEAGGLPPRQKQALQLIAVRVPFGYTLLVEPQSIHGDSLMTGMFLMSMTGNHVAMATADTVFMKHKESSKNLAISFTDREKEDLNEDGSFRFQVSDMPRHLRPVVTSSQVPLQEVKEIDRQLKEEITDTVRSSSIFGAVKSLVWQPVIATSSRWEKTLGLSLP